MMVQGMRPRSHEHGSEVFNQANDSEKMLSVRKHRDATRHLFIFAKVFPILKNTKCKVGKSFPNEVPTQ